MIDAKTDKSTRNVEPSATKGSDPSLFSSKRGVKSEEHEKKSPNITMEELTQLLRKAFAKVAQNKGAPGPDKQTIEEVKKNLDKILPQLKADLLEGKYTPDTSEECISPKGKGSEG